MAGRRIMFRVNEDIPAEKVFIEWLDRNYTDRSVPMKVVLLPVILRGMEREGAELVSADPSGVHALPKSAAAHGRNGKPHAIDNHPERESEGEGDAPRSGEDAFPLDKLSFE